MTSSNVLKRLKCCLVCGMVTALDSRGPGQVAGLQTHRRDTHLPCQASQAAWREWARAPPAPDTLLERLDPGGGEEEGGHCAAL